MSRILLKKKARRLLVGLVKPLLLILTAVALIGTLPGCGTPGDPLDDLYTKNVSPGTDGEYSIGSDNYSYKEGWFAEEVYIGDVPTSGPVRKVDFNDKGDILTATDNNTPAILSIGAEGQVLTVASANTTGLKWADAGGAANLTAHNLGGEYHNADSLANLNSLINDATLDDSSDTRTPSAHTIASHSDTAATGAELEELTDSSETTLHSHAVDGMEGAEAGGGGANGKSGSRQVPSQIWTAVTFNTAFDDANYAITFGVETPTVVNDWKMLFYRNKVTTGFEIYTKEKSGGTVYIDWVATPYNDP